MSSPNPDLDGSHVMSADMQSTLGPLSARCSVSTSSDAPLCFSYVMEVRYRNSAGLI